ncbi:hypothetical protein D3C73_431380 [compost metagenome]
MRRDQVGDEGDRCKNEDVLGDEEAHRFAFDAMQNAARAAAEILPDHQNGNGQPNDEGGHIDAAVGRDQLDHIAGGQFLEDRRERADRLAAENGDHEAAEDEHARQRHDEGWYFEIGNEIALNTADNAADNEAGQDGERQVYAPPDHQKARQPADEAGN